MKIATALGLDNEHPGTMISLVGAGGKTSSMFTLAEELAALGHKVLITTSTAIYNPVGIHNPYISVLGDHVSEEGKLMGLSKEKLNHLSAGKIYDFILVEADGSKGLPVKAPAGHEPVIPEATNITVGVIGMDCYGKRPGPAVVHRPEIFTALTGISPDDIIEDNAILALIASPMGLFKNCPEGSKKVLLLNKATEHATLEAAGRIGKKALEECRDIDRVLIGAVQETPPLRALLRR